MEPCGCPSKGRHAGVCQRRSAPPPDRTHVRVLSLKAHGLNSQEVHRRLKEDGLSVTLAQVNKFYASGL